MSYYKEFENRIKQGLEAVGGYTYRLHDQQSGYFGSKNPCDFFHYSNPFFYLVECKAHQGNTLPWSCISDNQWDSMLEASKVPGVISGVFVWWTDYDETWYVPITVLNELRQRGYKSLNYRKYKDSCLYLLIDGTKKRTYFNYNFSRFISMKYVLRELQMNCKKYVDFYEE